MRTGLISTSFDSLKFRIRQTFSQVTQALISCLVFSMLVSQPILAQGVTPHRPNLVVLIVASQLNQEFLSRYQSRLGSGGLRYLMEHGARFVNCSYLQPHTDSATGHSIIATGAYPWATGIIGDSWYDRKRGKIIAAINEDGMHLVGANGSAGGTRNLYGTTIGDQMKLATNGRSKVFSIGLKESAAILLAGRLSNAAYWFDTRSGAFVSSSQYGSELPSWVKSFNDQHFADVYLGKPWQRLLPETDYNASTRDDNLWERPLPGDGRQFPHIITGGATSAGEAFYNVFAMTPWANQLVANFAREAIEREHLGQHADPDFLAVDFSASEELGRSFGPYSQEMEDLVLRLDVTLSGFFQYLDQKVGINHCLIVFTSDHGLAPIPQFLRERGLDAGRIDPKSFQAALNSALSSRLGRDQWITALAPPNLYLNLEAIDRERQGSHYRQADVEALAAKIARSVPGIGDVFTAVQFYLNQLPTGPRAAAAARGYYAPRSGELILLTKPGYIFSSEVTGSESGSTCAYDRQVPLIIAGPMIRQGMFGKAVSPADIAPTIASLLEIGSPQLSEGRTLTEAILPVSGPPAPRTRGSAREYSPDLSSP